MVVAALASWLFLLEGEKKGYLFRSQGNTYNFKFSSPESSATGYSNADHPFYISTGTIWNSGTYTNEYVGGVTGSRAYYGGTSSTLKFKVPGLFVGPAALLPFTNARKV